ncbi:MAG TPA: hypothetical protein VLC28_15055 [Flavitalea sp.]|nr:hypothetical protein [Flavitalea sp.]
MDSFVVTIRHEGISKDFEVQLLASAYTYRIQVQLNDRAVYFEPDEERNLRAIVPAGIELNRQQLELLSLIGQELENILRK